MFEVCVHIIHVHVSRHGLILREFYVHDCKFSDIFLLQRISVTLEAMEVWKEGGKLVPTISVMCRISSGAYDKHAI